MGVSTTELEELKRDEETEFPDDDTEDVGTELLVKAINMLKRNALLFDYMSDPSFCRSLSKREREIMAAQSERIDTLTDELDEALSALEDSE